MKERFQKYLQQQMGEIEEDQFLRDWFAVHYDEKYRQHYTRLLEQEGLFQKNGKAKRVAMRWKRWLGVAVIALLALTLWQFITHKPLAPDQLVASFLEEKPFRAPQFRTGQTGISKQWAKAVEWYNEENFAAAASILEKITRTEETRAEHHFYLGLCYLYQGEMKNQQAIESFLMARKADSLIYEDELDWYLGLAYIRTGESERAKTALQQLIRRNRWRIEEAQQLLNSLPLTGE